MTKVNAVASDGEFWVEKVLSTIESLEEDKKHVKAIADVDEEEITLFTKARQTIIELRKVGMDQDSISDYLTIIIGIAGTIRRSQRR